MMIILRILLLPCMVSPMLLVRYEIVRLLGLLVINCASASLADCRQRLICHFITLLLLGLFYTAYI